MISFKLRLVVYFVLLSLVPLAGATWAFSVAAGRNELQRADTSLNKSVRAAVGDVRLMLEDASRQATSLARSTDVQSALVERDSGALAKVAVDFPGAAFYVGDELLAGSPPPVGTTRTATVVDGTTPIGRVAVGLAFDDRLLQDLAEPAGLEPEEQLALVVDGRVAAGRAELRGEVATPPFDEPADVSLSGATYRTVGTTLPSDGHNVQLLALAPRAGIDSTVTDLNSRLILAALGSIAIVAAVAFLPGRAIVASLREFSRAAAGVAAGRFSERVPVRGRDEFAKLGRAFNDMASELQARHEELMTERRRAQSALDRLGAALTASNEPGALLDVIADSALEASGAVGVTVVEDGREVARAGSPEAGGDPVSLDLGPAETGGRELLLLYPRAGVSFPEDAVGDARSLATQASIALENARLHRLLSRQVVTDELTQLANRRRFEEALAHELSRVQRFGGPLSLIVADLDDFKSINDRFGHQVGDRALVAFADVIRATVRAVDIPARPGGEEFAVILPGTALAEACAVAERLRGGFSACRVDTPVAEPLMLTASFGVAEQGGSSNPADLFAAADAALYEAKARGKNRVVAARELARTRPD